MQRIKAKELQEIQSSDGNPNYVELPKEVFERVVDALRYYDNMSGDKFQAPALSQATQEFIIDEFGEIKAEISPRQTYEKLLGNWLKNQREQNSWESGTVITGEKYQVTFKWVEKMITDGDAIAAYMHDQAAFIQSKTGGLRALEMADFMKPSQYWEARCAKLAE